MPRVNTSANPATSSISTEGSQQKQLNLLRAIRADINACDIKWTLFVAAASSYRFDSQLKPMPSQYLDGKTFDIDKLRRVIASVPPFHVLLEQLKAPSSLPNDVVDLLHWILLEVRDPYLKSVNRARVSIEIVLVFCVIESSGCYLLWIWCCQRCVERIARNANYVI